MLKKISEPFVSIMKTLPGFVTRYRYVIGGLLVLIIFGATILRIGALSSPEMNQERYNEGLVEQRKVIFNEDAIKRINELDKRTVNVRENIDKNRTNPF